VGPEIAREPTVERNAARGIARAGLVCGAAFVVVSAIDGCVHG